MHKQEPKKQALQAAVFQLSRPPHESRRRSSALNNSEKNWPSLRRKRRWQPKEFLGVLPQAETARAVVEDRWFFKSCRCDLKGQPLEEAINRKAEVASLVTGS